MSFNTAITGLKSASTMLDVTGNNIANVGTTGFKSSRTEFADIYATSVVGAGSSNTPGSGVTVSGISQDFSAGTIEFTNNNLDLAINGSGFFQLSDGQGSTTYSRAGAFELNKEGQIISKSGKFLQGYGLDANGNRLPIGNLEVSQKESPPKATEAIDLSFNIDARADSSSLLPVYNKDEPGSFTYTTTVRSFDSLGNEQTLKFNFAEQRPVRNVYQFDLAGFAGDPVVSSVAIDPADLPVDPNALPAWAIELAGKDPRIDLSSIEIDAGNDTLNFELKAWATDLGEVVVTDGTAPLLRTQTNLANPYRDANEARTYMLNVAGGDGQINIGGVSVTVDPAQSSEQVADSIVARQAQILNNNPDIESIQKVTDGGNFGVQIRFKADAGNIPDNRYVPEVVVNAGTIDFGDDTSGTIQPDDVIQGDNDYRGNYRMYGYLNGEELLDMGKQVDWGNPGGGQEVLGGGGETEPGPILLGFNPTNGLLNSINGQTFPPGSAAPSLIISGADPANELTTIDLDLANSTQFASASIVKNQQQDGYTKGDLIGVTFAPTGEMIASFSNGQNQELGVVAFATFENQDGLQPSGDTEWIATLASGNAILNPPGTGLNGTLRSAALEQSNVDLSTELVNLIQAQRNFQASSKTLETANNITQTILNI
ncbi:flagellar hook protein FlgE [Nitrincola sp. A-D6]|uniref:flagellar hook-basal body complex protein n=1 Tax=Nitrincola sp. A-D6 TaxID=1545442 RepID=UPI00051FA3CC|nr:flagellar hook-basal body complex protein [Nitrincola sp. A-D6]KGK41507.1 flagellar hook protein FlgE [Nitrincola sp. A-D6]